MSDGKPGRGGSRGSYPRGSLRPPWKPGQSGNPSGKVGQDHGARVALMRVLRKHPEMLEKAWLKGLTAEPPKSSPYLTLALYYTDGKPVERIEQRQVTAIRIFKAGARPDPTDPTGEGVIGPDGQPCLPEFTAE